MVIDNPDININKKMKARENSKTSIGQYKALINELNKKRIHHSFTLDEYLSLEDKKCEYCNKQRHSVCPKNLQLGDVSENLQPVFTKWRARSNQ